MAEAGRSLWAALNLLDRQVIDRDGLFSGKVDDLEITESADPDGLPVVTAILTGQAALAARFGPRLGRAVELLRRVIRPEPEPGPGRISFGLVREVGTAIEITVPRNDLETSAVESWLAAHVLSHVPGSGIRR
jgi:hypothetical protein